MNIPHVKSNRCVYHVYMFCKPQIINHTVFQLFHLILTFMDEGSVLCSKPVWSFDTGFRNMSLGLKFQTGLLSQVFVSLMRWTLAVYERM